VVDAKAIRAAGQVVPPPRLDARAHREHEQGVVARVGHVAPGPRGGAIDAGDARRADARRRAAQEPSARVAQLEDALAAVEDDGSPVGERDHFARPPGGRRKLVDRFRTAPGERHQRGDTEREAGI
jgi:hypothetical protein